MVKTKISLKIMNIPVHKTVKWNDIKKCKSFKLKTIDDEEKIEELIVDFNPNHFNKAKGTLVTI